MARALFSVSDKNGLADLALGLADLGWQLVASGGTAGALRTAGLEVRDVAEVTGSPEVLGGRVKTLHPAIHAGILARDSDRDRLDLATFGWEPFELVVVNLYPFEQTVARAGVALDEAVENIDIGGVALLRAAAKNFARVAVVCDPADYEGVLAEVRAHGSLGPDTRRALAVKAFAHTARYDHAIHAFLSGNGAPTTAGSPLPLQVTLHPVQSLRYGENPHQQALLYSYAADDGPLGGQLLQGKELSYNNLLDLNAAWQAALSFDSPAVAIVKHLSPCGIATAASAVEAFRAALASDPVSAFGGVIAANVPFDGEAAAALGELFVECIAAPEFDEQARAELARRKNCRMLRIPDPRLEPAWELRSVNRGVLWQTLDLGDPSDAGEWRTVTRRAPDEAELLALRFAWIACRHVKSNAIVFAQGSATVGIGGGQPNRVDCVRIAAERAGARARGAVCASDAFFPFPDGIEAAAQAGVTAIVQPGGSVRDEAAIVAADAAGLAMMFTGVRHFRH
jgi:phosphoribosylaminoimidazolecarboxamide formyltransferase/IMP cyclohydrolase